MTMPGFDLPAYLARIRLGEVPRSAAGLCALQVAQLRAIPFENLDPFLGRVPDLSPGAVLDKLLARGRGGYCFELNALLAAALGALGFPVRRALGRVRKGAAEGGARSHLVLLSAAGGRRYLVDAGFGGPGALAPLALDAAGAQRAPNGLYRLRDDPRTGERVVERLTDDGWFALYGFDEAHVGEADIAGANHLCATWVQAPFRDHLMLNAHDRAARVALFDRMLTVETPAGTTRRELRDLEDFAATLRGPIGLRIDGRSLRRAWRRLAAAPAAG